MIVEVQTRHEHWWPAGRWDFKMELEGSNELFFWMVSTTQWASHQNLIHFDRLSCSILYLISQWSDIYNLVHKNVMTHQLWKTKSLSPTRVTHFEFFKSNLRMCAHIFCVLACPAVDNNSVWGNGLERVSRRPEENQRELVPLLKTPFGPSSST